MTTPATTPKSRGYAASKVPQITAVFWTVKILTTGMGETASDYLAHTIGAIAVPLGFLGFSVALALQLRSREYIAWRYWLAVTMVSVFGTMAADVLQWHRAEGTLSIHSIRTKPRELYYWATVLATFALGTAAGDMTAVTFGWGYLLSGIIFAVLFAIPLAGGRWLRWPEVATFWTAYVLTRPLGASFADWLAVSHERGGLALGTGLVTILWSLAIVALVAWLAISHRDVEPES